MISFLISVIICAGTSEDTIYVNLNKTIQTFWYLSLPLPAISVPWPMMDIILNHEQCVSVQLFSLLTKKKSQGVSISFIPDHKSQYYPQSLCVNPKRRHRFLDNTTLLADYNMKKIRPFFEHAKCPYHAYQHNVINTPLHYLWQVVE